MGEEEVPYSLVPQGGGYNSNREPQTSSRHFTGKATATYPNGDKYQGDFQDGVSFNNCKTVLRYQIRQGKGVYTFSAGHIYTGDWNDNKKHGVGKITYKDGQNDNGSYYGYWADNKKHGQGVFSYVNGDIYSGQWFNNLKHGKGTYIIHSTGQKLVGTFYKGKLDNGKWSLANGNCYQGAFDNDKPQGVGVWTFANGNKIRGEYTQTKKVRLDNEDDNVEPEIRLNWRTIQSV